MQPYTHMVQLALLLTHGEDCSSFKSARYSLYCALASIARRIATTSIGLSVFIACHLIPLDKCPGVRPIGVGEVIRRIIAKAILNQI